MIKQLRNRQDTESHRGRSSLTKPELIKGLFEDENMSNAEAATTFFVAETSPPRWSRGEVEPTGTAASLLWTLGVLNEITKDWDGSEERFVERLEQKISEGLITVEALSSSLKIYELLKKRLRPKKWISKVIIRDGHKKEQESLKQEIETLKRKLEDSKRQVRERLEEVDKEGGGPNSDDE